MMGTFVMVCMMIKVGLSLNKGIMVKIHPTPLGFTKIKVLGFYCPSLFTPTVRGLIMVSY